MISVYLKQSGGFITVRPTFGAETVSFFTQILFTPTLFIYHTFISTIITIEKGSVVFFIKIKND